MSLCQILVGSPFWQSVWFSLSPPRKSSWVHISVFCPSLLLNPRLILFLQACLTVWWIILRYMEDIPEPKSADAFSQASSTISSRVLPHKQSRRLSSLVGLDQVKHIKHVLFLLLRAPICGPFGLLDRGFPYVLCLISYISRYHLGMDFFQYFLRFY